MKWSLIQFVDNADDYHVFIIINIAKYIIVIFHYFYCTFDSLLNG